jgi:arylformamidase
MTREPTIDTAAEFSYVAGQGRPTWGATIADYARRSEATAARPGVRTDLPYGPHPRQRFDVIPAEGEARAALIWLHPGYWQMRDRRAFRFLGETFAALGCDAVFADYPLAPERDVAAITEAVRDLVPAVRTDGRAVNGRALPIVAAGHSAGAHLAVELALTDFAGRGEPAAIAAVLAVSGVYDLEPLIATSLDRALGLTPATARAASPVHRAGAASVPALFVVGGGETEAFRDQSRAMEAAWRAAGAASRLEIVDAEDHFSILERLADPADALRPALVALIAAASGDPGSAQ